MTFKEYWKEEKTKEMKELLALTLAPQPTLDGETTEDKVKKFLNKEIEGL